MLNDDRESPAGISCVFLAALLLAAWMCGCGKGAADKADEAVEQTNQAAILYNRQDYPKAHAAISQAITLNSELRRDSALGENYLLLALCQRKLGQYDSAISAFKISLEYFHTVGDQQLERRGRIAMADLLYALGEFKDAQSLASDAAGEAKVFSDLPNRVHALLLVAKASRRLQDLDGNASALDELGKIAGKEVPRADLLRMKFRAGLASGDPVRIRDAFERWNTYMSGTGDSTGLAGTYAAWGFYQLSQNRLDSALQSYSSALNMIGGISSRTLQTEVLAALGIIAYRSARYENARLYFQEAQALARQEDNIINDQLLALIIVACDWKNGGGSRVNAPEFAKRCAEIGAVCRQAGFRAGTMFALWLRGTIEYRSRDTAAARVSFSDASGLNAQNVMPGMEEYPVYGVVQAFMEGERLNWSDPLLEASLDAQRYDDCFALAEELNLREMQRFFTRSSFTTSDVHLDHAAEQLRLKRSELQLLEEDVYEELAHGNNRNVEHVTALNALYPERLRELHEAEKNLQGTSLQWLVTPPAVSLSAVRDTLPMNTALLEFVPLPEELHCLVVTKDSVYDRSTQITRPRLLSLIDEYNRLIGDPRLNSRVAGFDAGAAQTRVQDLSSVLSNILIAPVYGLIAGSAKLYVVPPPDFGWLPFHTLRAGGAPLEVKTPVSYLPSAAALFFRPKQETFVSTVVGLGHPGRTNWDVEYELKDIRSFYDKAKMLFDTAATLDHLKPLSYDVLDIAAEFDLNKAVPDNSSVVLSDGVTPDGLRDVPLGEMMSVSYPPTLVFSNIAPAPGGLSRYAPMLFLAGGTRTVVATMWQGDRLPKKYFGEVFYTNLMTGTPAATAYHQAMAAMSGNPDFSRPHRWGLYFIFGR